jgi:hypothetical protein
MKKLAMLLFVLAMCVPAVGAASIDLGTAGDFAVLAGSGVTNSTAGTVINGDVGSSPTPAIVGLLAADVNGILWPAAGAVVVQAKADLVDAYNEAVAATDGNTDEPVDLSGRTLDPNIYLIGSADFSAGTLTLDGGGDANAQWIFHTGDMTTAADFNVALTNGASASNVFWQVGTSATIGIRNHFAGNILAMTTITFNGGGALNGRALARNGHVTISTPMTITVPGAPRVSDVTDANSTAHAVLVYKVTVQGSLADFTDDNGTDAELIKEKVVGYIVADVDVATLNSFMVRVDDPDVNDAIDPNHLITIDDVNYEPIGIALGNKEFAEIRHSTDSNVSVDCTLAEEEGPIFNILNKKGVDTKKDAVWASFRLGVSPALGLNVSGSGVAKLSSAAIGRPDGKTKINIPKSIKGPGNLDLSSESAYSYDAKGTCQLDTKYTKRANAGKLSTKATADLITADLEKKHWTSKTIYQLFSSD